MISLEKARAIYNEFPVEGRDIPFMAFYMELNDLTDERKIQEDLLEIQLMKARRDSNRLLIDRAVQNANNG